MLTALAHSQGFSPAASTSTLTARKPAAAPSESQAPLNPFFGHKQIKKGSSSMHVKEDFTPFKTGVVHEPGSIGAFALPLVLGGEELTRHIRQSPVGPLRASLIAPCTLLRLPLLRWG